MYPQYVTGAAGAAVGDGTAAAGGKTGSIGAGSAIELGDGLAVGLGLTGSAELGLVKASAAAREMFAACGWFADRTAWDPSASNPTAIPTPTTVAAPFVVVPNLPTPCFYHLTGRFEQSEVYMQPDLPPLVVHIRPRVHGMWRLVLMGWAIRLFGLRPAHVDITMNSRLG